MFDEFLAWMLLVAGLCLLGYNPTRAALAISFAGVVLLGVLEPLSLHLWGTTPGRPCWGCGWLEWMEKTSHTARA